MMMVVNVNGGPCCAATKHKRIFAKRISPDQKYGQRQMNIYHVKIYTLLHLVFAQHTIYFIHVSISRQDAKTFVCAHSTRARLSMRACVRVCATMPRQVCCGGADLDSLCIDALKTDQIYYLTSFAINIRAPERTIRKNARTHRKTHSHTIVLCVKSLIIPLSMYGY